jgi:hypothetical protein
MKKSYILISILILVSLTACSGSNKSELPYVEAAWARPAPAGGTSAIYFTLQNPGEDDDRLISASGDVAESVEIHMSMMNDDGVMSMQEQEYVAIPAGGSVLFEPGGLHIMLIDLVDELTVGDQFDINLTFEDSGEMRIPVVVKAP